ncbi:MAG: hypothetical protein M1820_006615 [Bogoriella megaspora]|nr:MAG: hypothetical protein M1820_006615 [Bogoriella megaspora]
MNTSSAPRRLIYCVDGTWCGPDGKSLVTGNLTNVYQIYASIDDSTKTGSPVDDGYFQEPLYEPGIGSADDSLSMKRIRAGIFGKGFLKQIKKVYEKCCKLGQDDEVWLFGFSRGAFVVRAVAGLLHYLRAISSAGTAQFDEDYKTALKIYEAMQKQGQLGPGRIHSYFSATTHDPPKIKFVGVFDTVKAVNDRDLFDISFNDSIQNLRHALAFHEDREAFSPEYIYPNTAARLGKRTFIQSWFVGAHIDMGGSAAKAGLSLYPLQWMLLESRALGLKLAFMGTFGRRASITNPLHLVFPTNEAEGRGADDWMCQTQNGVKIFLQDIRKVHDLKRHGGQYEIKLNRHHSTFWPKRRREAFDENGGLNGWSFHAQGTVIHPSVYLLLDESVNISLDTKDQRLQNHIEHYRQRILGMVGPNQDVLNPGFWNEHTVQPFDNPGAIRVLVCGNTGVGKSTLINRVFGVPVTTESSRSRGIHDVKSEIRFAERPDLIVHDSGGFEAGAVEEMDVVKEFLQEKSRADDINDRLHVIWFCIDLMSTRTKQHATEKLFTAVSQYAKEVPIIVVTTKMDEFLGAKFQEYRDTSKEQGKRVDMDECDQYAEEQKRVRVLEIRKEMLEVDGGRLDACVPVSKRDDNSIKELTEITSRCFSSERVRLLYIRAQVSRIDLKINLAVGEVIRSYKRAIRGASLVAGIPLGPTSTRTGSAIDVCKTIITCFGLPSVTVEMAMQILKNNVLEDAGNNIVIALSEGMATLGLLSSIFTAGMPAFLASGAVNVPLVVPATARLLLLLAADMILILTNSFREAAVKNIGQPLAKDLGAAARAYRPLAANVHRRIKELVPRRNFLACYRYDKIGIGFEKIIEEYRDKVTGGDTITGAGKFADTSDQEPDPDTDGTLVDDIEEAKGKL